MMEYLNLGLAVDFNYVEYEPWHWRYVGVDNARKMNKLNVCLEEYIDWL